MDEYKIKNKRFFYGIPHLSNYSKYVKILMVIGIALYVVMFLGKAFYLPLSLAISANDNSAFRKWDLFIGVADYVIKSSNNSLVFACRNNAFGTSCITGRVIFNGYARYPLISLMVLNNNSSVVRNARDGMYVVAVNNYRVYTVLILIPREIWVPLWFLMIVLALFHTLRYIAKSSKAFFNEVNIFSLAVLILILINVCVIGATYIDQATPIYVLPGVRTRYTFNPYTSTITLDLDIENKDFVVVKAFCYLSKKHNNNLRSIDRDFPLNTSVDGNKVKVFIPWIIYEDIYRNTSCSSGPITPTILSIPVLLFITCSLNLSVAELNVVALAEFSWRDLELYVSNSTVYIRNMNPVAMNAKLYIVDLFRGETIYIEDIVIERYGYLEKNVEGLCRGRCMVQIHYSLCGINRSRVEYIDVLP